MPLYSCEICNVFTNLKSNHNRHLKTKKHERNKQQFAPMNQNEPQMNQNEPQMNQNEPQMNQAIKKEYNYKCQYCEETFNTLPSKRRHELHRCKKIPVDNTNILKQFIKQQKTHEKEKAAMKKQIEMLITKVGSTTIKNNNSNNINNTIVLNNYGQEDLSHITDVIKTQFLKIPYGMIPKMIEEVHFNKDKPENKNIKITNSRDNKLKIYKNNKWVYKDKSETLNDLVDSKYFMLDTHYSSGADISKLNEFQQSNYKKFRELIDDGDKLLIENIKKDCEIILLNNR